MAVTRASVHGSGSGGDAGVALTRLVDEYLMDESFQRVMLIAEQAREVVQAAIAEVLRPRVAEVRCATVPDARTGQPAASLPANCGASDLVVFLQGSANLCAAETKAFMASDSASAPRVVRVFDAEPSAIEEAYRAPRSKLEAINAAIIAIASRASRVRVTSRAGTDLEVVLDNRRFGWISSCGHAPRGKARILPPSEVASYSDQVDGVFVANGAVNSNFGYPFDPRLEEQPVTIDIRSGRVIGVTSENIQARTVVESMRQIPNGDRIGEVGIGTNVGIQRFLPLLSHTNERFPACHLGLGGNNQGLARAGWQCGSHFDLISGPCTIVIDDHVIFEDGRLVLDPEELVPDSGSTGIGLVDTE